MAITLEAINKSLSFPKDNCAFFIDLGEKCRAIGHESKSVNLTETAFYQVTSTMKTLYKNKKISLSTYSAIAYVYQEWSRFRHDSEDNDGWEEIITEGLELSKTFVKESNVWKDSFLMLLYEKYEHTNNIEERWQLLLSIFLPIENAGVFTEYLCNLCRGILLMETVFLMEKRGKGSDVKSSITLLFKAAETIRYCYDNRLGIEKSLTGITATTALRNLSEYYNKNQAHYRRYDEDMALRIEKLLNISKDPAIKISPSVTKSGRNIYAGIFIVILGGILILCSYILYRELFPPKEKLHKHEQFIQEQYTRQSGTEGVVDNSLPFDLAGLYFVPKAEGASVKGVTARIKEIGEEKYDMAIYSDMPIRHYSLTLNRARGQFQSEELGDGYITFDEQSKSTTINFSDIWILTK